MRPPAIDQIVIEASAFISCGDEYARRNPRNELTSVISAAMRLGLDAHTAVSEIFVDLNSIQRHQKKLRRMWVILIVRCAMIWAGVIFLRGVLLQILDASAWMTWVRTDRLLLASALFLAVILIGLLTNWHLRRGPSLQNQVWANFCQYVTMGRDSVCCPNLRRDLKKIAIDEWRTGVCAQSSRLMLLKNRLSSIGDDIDQECVTLGPVMVGTELSMFAIGFMGLIFAPLMAWMESASGVN